MNILKGNYVKMVIIVFAMSLFACSEIYDKQKQLAQDLVDIDSYISLTSLTPSGELVNTEGAPAGSIPLLDTIKKQSNLYFLNLKEGAGNQMRTDRVALIAYKAYVLGSNEPYEISQDYPQGTTIALNYAIEGMKLSVSMMKAGILNEDETYTDPGQAYIIMPSTMAYQNNIYKDLPKNSILIFRVTSYYQSETPKN